MKARRYLLFLVLFLIVFDSYGQTKIAGKIIDKSDSTGVPFASIVIYKYQSSKIINYTQTNEEGYYSMVFDAKPQVITIKVHHLSYQLYQQDIVIGAESSQDIRLNIALTPKVEKLEDVVIQGPIIVKEDTIIYDVEHWTEARDQTLEEVLEKIPGFKIRPDGEIEVEGKTVKKILIDGEELTKSGARLLTRSIAPEDVKNVEVRFDEKNNKIKDSILDSEKFVVLDIQLNDDLNKSLFGKVRATLGYQNDPQVGGYANAFSLNRKLKVHLFAEHDRFGEQTISLKDIRNIGHQELKKSVANSADFADYESRKSFQEDLYGFKNFTVGYKDIIGVSTRYIISPYVDLYFGSYNAYSKNEKNRTISQEFNDRKSINQFREIQQVVDYSSKNKLALRIDKGKVKARIDANAILSNNDFQNPVDLSSNRLQYRYQDEHQSRAFYQNLLVEYTPSTQWGLRGVASYSWDNSDHDKKLSHNNKQYRDFIRNEKGSVIYNFSQNTLFKTTNLFSEVMVQNRSKIGQINFGFNYLERTLEGQKSGNQQDTQGIRTTIPQFTSNENNFSLHKWSPFVQHHLKIRKFSFDNILAIANVTYPTAKGILNQTRFFEFDTRVLYTPIPFFNFLVQIRRKLSQFPLQKMAKGDEISGFQSLIIPNRHPLRPTPENLHVFIITKKFNDMGVFIESSLYMGSVQNLNRQRNIGRIAIAQEYDQLTSKHQSGDISIRKNFKKIPFEMKFLLEIKNNQLQNNTNTGELYKIFTDRKLWNLKMKTLFVDKPYDFHLHPKFTVLSFKSEISNFKRNLEMFSIDFSTDIDLFQRKILLSTSLRAVSFLGNVNANFTNISLRIESSATKFRWFISADNLLNNTSFTTQSIFPTFFNTDNNSVFDRYVKFGIEYKFK